MSGHHRKRGRWAAAAAAEPDHVRRQVEALFSRRFDFCAAEHDWRLPEPEHMFPDDEWQVAELQTMKHELNAVKALLSDKDISTWHEHTSATNRAGLVVPTVKRHIRPEMGTQAWCKFYELLSLGSVLPPACADGGRLVSLHLCEAPGAFVTALNHYCILNGVEEWDWHATTLNPYYEANPLSRMISDDRFILHTLSRWHFGADDTGDLMNPANADHLIEVTGAGVNLVTADGSVDCQGEPAEQERIVAGLHHCEVWCALRALQPGGTLVVKMFTFYESGSVCLLFLLSCCFAEVSVVKPSCSKSGNSEVYVMCRRLAAGPLSGGHLERWRRRYGADGRQPLFARHHVPDTFIRTAGAVRQAVQDVTGGGDRSEPAAARAGGWRRLARGGRRQRGGRRPVPAALPPGAHR
ncbi:cap-specific mRNA (nucleoside-2'-O-)-methyltransferase 2-like [Pollicipes pollicipes]|uniref:cap-specific mRNA (nucleoside-2'-O-)-methyltransferase 2-like n=1 Tax=Pollicipes pollicipes TaxID=41117 RepID=UPI0018854185|nr:cap-specific mRNA (nucleoside-2'-O-)-methyltransferase 2-like [Pollicipes pollicipes]